MANLWFVGAGVFASGVELACDWEGDVGEFLLLFVKVFGSGGGAVLIEPFGCLFDCFEELWCDVSGLS